MTAPIKMRLLERGVEIPHPDLVCVDADVSPENIEKGVRLEPGCRLEGERTIIGAGSRLGSGGPVVVRNCAIGRRVDLASGSFEDALFLDDAAHGPAAHVRKGTIFEEGASAAHAVGTKQAILLPHATLGSNINFCDALLAGGTGPKDHSEVGSGFIHFNFTPFGPHGDKATPSLFGDVSRGAWLRERRIFLGGAGGVVGPIRVGFGTTLAAGGVYRRDRGEDVLVLGEELPNGERTFDPMALRRVAERVRKNLTYMAQLVALRHLYRHVRLPLAGSDANQVALVKFGLDLLQGALQERTRQLGRLHSGLEASIKLLRSASAPNPDELSAQEGFQGAYPKAALVPDPDSDLADPQALEDFSTNLPGKTTEFPSWVEGLSDDAVAKGRTLLSGVVASYLADSAGPGLILSSLPPY